MKKTDHPDEYPDQCRQKAPLSLYIIPALAVVILIAALLFHAFSQR